MRKRYHVILSVFLFICIGAGYGKSNIMEKEIGKSLPELTVEADTARPFKGAAVKSDNILCENVIYHPFTIHLEINMYRESALSSSDAYNRSIGQVFITRTPVVNATWYSVDHGFFKTVKEAVSKMQELKAKRLIPKDAYVGVAVPYTVEIASTGSRDKANRELSHAKKRGVSAYIIQKNDSCFKVCSGAFPNKDIAEDHEKEIRNLGLNARVAPR